MPFHPIPQYHDRTTTALTQLSRCNVSTTETIILLEHFARQFNHFFCCKFIFTIWKLISPKQYLYGHTKTLAYYLLCSRWKSDYPAEKSNGFGVISIHWVFCLCFSMQRNKKFIRNLMIWWALRYHSTVKSKYSHVLKFVDFFAKIWISHCRKINQAAKKSPNKSIYVANKLQQIQTNTSKMPNRCLTWVNKTTIDNDGCCDPSGCYGTKCDWVAISIFIQSEPKSKPILNDKCMVLMNFYHFEKFLFVQRQKSLLKRV